MELKLLLLKARKALLESRGTDNANIVRKINRQIRKFENLIAAKN